MKNYPRFTAAQMREVAQLHYQHYEWRELAVMLFQAANLEDATDELIARWEGHTRDSENDYHVGIEHARDWCATELCEAKGPIAC